MYDGALKKIRDKQWIERSAYLRGIAVGEQQAKLELIRTLQQLAQAPVQTEAELQSLSLDQLEVLASELRAFLVNRPTT